MSATQSSPHVQRHTVLATMITTDTGIMTARLACPFVPTEMKVKQVSFFRDNNTTVASQGTFTIHVRGIGPGDSLYPTVLGCVIDPCVSFPGITIPVSGFSSGQYTFEIRMNGALALVPQFATLNLILEFRRYV